MRLHYVFIIKIIILLFYPSYISAQVNIEKFRKELYPRGFSGYIELDLSSRTGNVDLTEITIENRNDYMWKDINSFLISRGDYGWQDGKQYSNEALIHLRNVFRVTSNWQPEVFAQIDYNKERLLSFRGLFGSGLRFAIYNSNETKFWCGTAFMIEHERLDLIQVDSNEKEVTVIRWSNYLTTNIDFNELIEWTSTTYFQPLIEHFGDIRIISETNLDVKLIKQLSLIIGFQMRYDSKPPDNIKSLDTSLRNGLVMKF